jgi:AcrR family transcriptional regulator
MMDRLNLPLDRRIQRTRQLLRNALFALIIERGYESIAIQDITERANLGRATFYLHYQDKEELLKASVKALMCFCVHYATNSLFVFGKSAWIACRLPFLFWSW